MSSTPTSSSLRRSARAHRTGSWERGAAGQAFELIISRQLLAEVKDVLTRPKFQGLIGADTATRFVEMIEVLADVVLDPEADESWVRDAKDDYLLALARAHQADYIVTGDKDLLEWPGQDPPVVSPPLFVPLLGVDE